MRRGAQSGGIRLARYTLRNRPPSFLAKIGRFLLKPDTQLRVSPCFGSRTRPARPFPNPRIFPVRGNQLHPRAKQRSTFPRLSPQERQNYITSPLPASTPPKLALGVGHSVPNRKSAPGCKSCVEFRQISFTFMRRKMSWINFFSPPKNRRSQGASRPSVLSFISSSLIVQARSAS